jgi:hypothetical protein
MALRNAETGRVHEPKPGLSTRVALLGSQPIPASSLRMALRNAAAALVHDPKTELSIRLALLGPLAQFKNVRCIAAWRLGFTT